MSAIRVRYSGRLFVLSELAALNCGLRKGERSNLPATRKRLSTIVPLGDERDRCGHIVTPSDRCQRRSLKSHPLVTSKGVTQAGCLLGTERGKRYFAEVIQAAGISPIREELADDVTDCGTSSLELRSVVSTTVEIPRCPHALQLSPDNADGLEDADEFLGDTSALQELAKMPELTTDRWMTGSPNG
jgi:hypothetical protein